MHLRITFLLSLLSALLSTKQCCAQAIPSLEQLAWMANQGAIIHYNMATYAHHQGCNRNNWNVSSDPKLFGSGGLTPSTLDTDSWGRAMNAANITYAVYVAKHNCGMTTWPTKVLLPDGSPYNYSIQYSSCPDCNVVQSFLTTCKKYNIHPGFYYSLATNTYLNVASNEVQPTPLLPGQVLVTQAQFIQIALAQLEELWSLAPGELFEVWADGGLPSDPTFRDGIIALKAKYQPQMVVFNGFPTFNSSAARWIGSEAGFAPDPTWSSGSCDQGNGNHKPEPQGGDPTSPNFCPPEVPSTLQSKDQWFYTEGLALHPLSDLQLTYETSLGHNANWLLDIAPGTNSSVAPSHMALYSQLGDWIRNCYGDASIVSSVAFVPGATQATLIIPEGGVDRIRLIEDLTKGQKVHVYNVSSSTDEILTNGTSIGSGKIDVFKGGATTASSLVIRIDTPSTGLVVQAFNGGKC